MDHESSAGDGGGGAEAASFAVLGNQLLPGFSLFSSAARAHLGVDVNAFLPLVLAVLALTVAWGHARDTLWGLVEDHLMSSVRVRTDDEIYNMVMLWLSRQRFARRSRRFLANTDITSRHRYMYRYGDSDDDSDDGGGSDNEAGGSDDDGSDNGAGAGGRRKPLHYTPAFGTHLFWYRGWPLLFERHQNREQFSLQSSSEREELSLSCFGRDPRVLKELLREARRLHRRRDERKTLIYRGNLAETYWQRCMSRLNRPFSTVILRDAVKRELLDDAADYLDPATRRWYANRGIPYRRGYLLHGPPGTGKSSLSLALAGFFRMKIYIVSLSSAAATEENITTLFNELPTRCIVLLEDIDTAGLTHTRDEDASSPAAAVPPPPPPPGRVRSTSPPSTSPPGPPPIGGRLSLSGLLNILDGVASQEGRILIMTTNHLEKLDKALIRPGRVDMVVPFGLADAEMASSIFRAIYAPYDNESASRRPSKSDAPAGDGEADEKRRQEERERVRQHVEDLAQRFASKLPEHEFSPAEVQGLLLRFKRSPEGALAAVDDWVARIRGDKKEQAEQEAERRRRAALMPPPKPETDSGSDDDGSDSDGSDSGSEEEPSRRSKTAEKRARTGEEKREGKERKKREGKEEKKREGKEEKKRDRRKSGKQGRDGEAEEREKAGPEAGEAAAGAEGGEASSREVGCGEQKAGEAMAARGEKAGEAGGRKLGLLAGAKIKTASDSGYETP
ncbi:hypothetical protein CDD83_8468 [Cordyceps sp. RAO-2017]|nr:hypothetical protein CDD83_8468 [Cordyceps sp. RAO-2017]